MTVWLNVEVAEIVGVAVGEPKAGVNVGEIVGLLLAVGLRVAVELKVMLTVTVAEGDGVRLKLGLGELLAVELTVDV